MNDIASRPAPGLPQLALRSMEGAPASSSPALDTKIRIGTGTLSERLIAVGDGQSAQRMQDGRAAQALLAGISPAIRALLADGAAGPALYGILQLKERQLGHGGGQGTA